MARKIIAGCDDCGVWLSGPFRRRRNVPIEDVRAYMEAAPGQPAIGEYVPAKGREGSFIYKPGPGEPYSGSVCPSCSRKRGVKKITRVRRIMGKPDPTPEEALAFFTTAPAAEEQDAERARRVMAKPQEQPQAPTGTQGEDDGGAS